jgi:hypothetical protein
MPLSPLERKLDNVSVSLPSSVHETEKPSMRVSLPVTSPESRSAGSDSKFPMQTTPPTEVPRAIPNGRLLRRGTGKIDHRLSVSTLPTNLYQELMNSVDRQLAATIKQSIYLQSRKNLLERLILYESLAFLVINSASTLIGTSGVGDSEKNISLYVTFGFGLFTGCTSILVKWLKNKHETDIENYRTSVKEIVAKYGQDAYFILEKRRLSLPAEVLASGFFRGIEEAKGNPEMLDSVRFNSVIIGDG